MQHCKTPKGKIQPSVGSQAEQIGYLPKRTKKLSQLERSVSNTVYQTLWKKNF